jgi:hypothetical protein
MRNATSLDDRIARAAAALSDEELLCELQCAEKCVLRATRTPREMAVRRLRCLARERERRKLVLGAGLTVQPL